MPSWDNTYAPWLIKDITGDQTEVLLPGMAKYVEKWVEGCEQRAKAQTTPQRLDHACITTPTGEALIVSRIDKSWFSHLPKCVFKNWQKLCTQKKWLSRQNECRIYTLILAVQKWKFQEMRKLFCGERIERNFENREKREKVSFGDCLQVTHGITGRI